MNNAFYTFYLNLHTDESLKNSKDLSYVHMCTAYIRMNGLNLQSPSLIFLIGYKL